MTAPKIEYQIVGASSQLKFEEAVNEALKNGWELYGYLSVTKYGYYQAMTRLISNKPKD